MEHIVLALISIPYSSSFNNNSAFKMSECYQNIEHSSRTRAKKNKNETTKKTTATTKYKSEWEKSVRTRSERIGSGKGKQEKKRVRINAQNEYMREDDERNKDEEKWRKKKEIHTQSSHTEWTYSGGDNG